MDGTGASDNYKTREIAGIGEMVESDRDSEGDADREAVTNVDGKHVESQATFDLNYCCRLLACT